MQPGSVAMAGMVVATMIAGAMMLIMAMIVAVAMPGM